MGSLTILILLIKIAINLLSVNTHTHTQLTNEHVNYHIPPMLHVARDDYRTMYCDAYLWFQWQLPHFV